MIFAEMCRKKMLAMNESERTCEGRNEVAGQARYEE